MAGQQGYIITQIDTLRPVFDAVANGYIRCYMPDLESEMAILEEQANLSEEEIAELLEDYEPAKFPYRGETKIVESEVYSKKGTD